MTRRRLDQAAATLGVAGVASLALSLTTSSNNFVTVQGAAMIVFPLLGMCALVGGITSRRILVRLAGAGYGAAPILQLARFGCSSTWIDGSGSTFALLSLWQSGCWWLVSHRGRPIRAPWPADPAVLLSGLAGRPAPSGR